MVLLAAALFGLSIGGVTWVFANRHRSNQLIAQRIADVSSQSRVFSGNHLDSFLHSLKNKTKEISLENMGSDKIAYDLFLAGIHDPKVLLFFHRLIKLSAAIPLFLVAFYAMTGSLTLRSAIGAGIAGLIIFIYVHLILRIFKQKRQKEIIRSLPQILDLLVVCIEAGLSFTAAIERILKELDPKNTLVKELKLMNNEFLGGLSLAKACERLDKRCGVSDLSLLLTSIVQSDQMGSSLGATLRAQAAEMRDKYKQRVRARALQIPVKILFPMVPIFLAFMLLNLAIVGFQLGAVIQSKNIVKIDSKTAGK